MRAPQWAVLVAVTLAAGLFARLNLGERAALNLGVARFYQVPVAWLVFGSFVVGMLVMFVLGLQHDRRVRRLLREQEHRHTAERAHRDTHPGVPM